MVNLRVLFWYLFSANMPSYASILLEAVSSLSESFLFYLCRFILHISKSATESPKTAFNTVLGFFNNYSIVVIMFLFV